MTRPKGQTDKLKGQTDRLKSQIDRLKSQTSCCICLDCPSDSNPIHLLACGCRAAWFHQGCQDSWTDSLQLQPLICPTCRRPVPVKTNYSFSYYAGPDQRDLWHIGIAITGETLITLYISRAQILPYQTLSIMLLPYVISSNKTMDFYIKHVKLKYILQAIAILLSVYDTESTIPMIVFYGYWYTIMLHLFTYVSYVKERPVRNDPCLPFAISREIIHIDTLT